MSDPRHTVTTRARQRIELHDGAAVGTSAADAVAVEEPLELRLAGERVAITMRTPGEDRALALGFLLAEGVIESRDDVGSLAHCGRPGTPERGNVLEILPAPGTAFDVDRSEAVRRGTLTSAACGVCGRSSIDDLLARCTPLPLGDALPLGILARSVSALEASQQGFARTGGLHAAALLDARGDALAVCEDVGRHNAVDKAVGTLVLAGEVSARAPGRARVLVVSGRVSFEIVQKAAAAGIPVVCGVSAPTSLAIDLAERAGITLAAFVRAGGLNLYTHTARIVL